MSNLKKSNTWTMEEVHKKNYWHYEVDTYWHQFWCHIWWWPKTLKLCIESVSEQFWWPSYLTSKLMSICVNLIIMPIYFFVNLLHSPYFWHLTSFWQLDIFQHLTGPAPSQREIFFQDHHTLSKRNIFSNHQGRYIPLTRVDTLTQVKVSTPGWGRYP